MPSPNRPRIGVKLVPNLLPSHVVDIPVAQHHAFIRVGDCFDHAADLGLEVNEPVDLTIDLDFWILHFLFVTLLSSEGKGGRFSPSHFGSVTTVCRSERREPHRS